MFSGGEKKLSTFPVIGSVAVATLTSLEIFPFLPR